MTAALTGRVTILSPHLDDAIFSLGAAIASVDPDETTVTILTVLAGDPESRLPSGAWDRAAGFATAGEAARARREEDTAAASLVGSSTLWLTYSDEQYPRGGSDEEILSEIARHVADEDHVLVPGHPLAQVDHLWLAHLVLADPGRLPRIHLYVEQPYASRLTVPSGRSLGVLFGLARLGARTRGGRRATRPPERPAPIADVLAGEIQWSALASTRETRTLKQSACQAYRSQLPLLDRSLLRRVALHERAFGGEAIGSLG